MGKYDDYLERMYNDLAIYAPFYMRVLFSIEIVKIPIGEDGPHMPRFRTAYTDCLTTIWVFEEFAEGLDYEEFVFLILHELGHVIYLSKSRQGLREPARWNAACDYAINYDLHELKQTNPLVAFYYRLIKGCLINTRYKGMTAEQIYDLLPENQDYSEYLDIVTGGDGDVEAGAEAVIDVLCEAMSRTEEFGNMPGGLQRDISPLKEGKKIDWKALLIEYIQPHVNDYDFKKGDRRYDDVFIPDIGGEKLEIALGLDMSGSITEDAAKFMVSEVLALLKSYQSIEVKAFTFDTKIINGMDLTSEDDIPEFVKMVKGGGGTSFVQPILTVQKRESIKAIIMMTDGYGDFPKVEKMTLPVLWLIIEGGKIPDEKYGKGAFI